MFKLYDNILKPEYVMPFGINYGHTLAEIYHYYPTYIEWLIFNIPEFEINIEDFESLPNPTVYFEIKNSATKHRGSITTIKYLENLKEIKFKFSEKAAQILLQKKISRYKKEKQYKIVSNVNIRSISECFKYYLNLR